MIGSVRVVFPGLIELQGLALLDITRYPKKRVCAISMCAFLYGLTLYLFRDQIASRL
jgi:hypothetical protein